MYLAWRDLVRTIVDGGYFLKEYLREEGDSGVFLAESPEGYTVEVRVAQADGETADKYSQRWSAAARLSHPNLIRTLRSGRFRIDGAGYLFLISEKPDEVLQDVLIERPLTGEEARRVLQSSLEALQYLHDNGFAHGGIDPSQIFAIDEQIKISATRLDLLPVDAALAGQALADETQAIGRTCIRILTQDETVSAGDELPKPFDEFARASLAADSEWTPTPAELMSVLAGAQLRRPAPDATSAAVEAAPIEAAPVATESAEPELPVVKPIPAPLVKEPLPSSSQGGGTYSTPLKEAPATPRPAAPPRLEPVSVSSTAKPKSRRTGILVAVTAAIVLAFVVFSALQGDEPRISKGRSEQTPATGRPVFEDRRQPEPVATAQPERPSPVGTLETKPVTKTAPRETPAARSTAAAAGGSETWAVVAAAYREFTAAERRASELGKRWSSPAPTVHPPEGQGRKYLVVLGSGLSKDEAERLRAKAASSGMPRDTYVTKLF